MSPGGALSRRWRGTTLIIVLGTLLLLALIATVFATLASVERSISRNYQDQVKAKMLAQSGVDRAVDLLRQVVSRGWFYKGSFDRTWMYYGNQNDESKEPNAAWRVEQATNPSFAWEDEPAWNPYNSFTTPKQMNVTLVGPGGESVKPVGFTDAMSSGTYGKNADTISLKILDSSSQINVNDGVKWGPNHSVSKNVQRLLNILGKLPEVNIESMIGGPLGDKILASRPPTGYVNEHDLLRALNYNVDALRKIRDYVCVNSWSDANVANPVPLSSTALGAYPVTYMRPIGSGGAIYRYGYNIDFWSQMLSGGLDFNKKVYDHRSLNPQWIEIVERSPVNVNTAPAAVLKVLIAELQGWYVLDQRRNNPYASPGLDSRNEPVWWKQKYTYNDATSCGIAGHSSHPETLANGDDSLGLITRTRKYYLPGIPFSAPAEPINPGDMDANIIVDEILACRRKVSCNVVHAENGTSVTHAPINYAVEAWGGAFRSWGQFHYFVDRLVERGVIKDPYPDPAKERVSSQAFADVLKANFNPNLHLNELNPDKNLYFLVDKTDLIRNSTEFCFTPTGVFEIESLARILRPVGSDDALVAPNNEVIAEKKIYAVVKLYDLHRTTNQRQFYRGLFAERDPLRPTNSSWSVETGPEPDNGPAIVENEWGGYLSLPTLYGNYTTPGSHKVKCNMEETAFGGIDFGSVIHAHFQTDHLAHYHGDYNLYPIPGYEAALQYYWRWPLGASWGFGFDFGTHVLIWYQENWSDKTEDVWLSPYVPISEDWFFGTKTGRYRLCRSYRVPPSQSPTAPVGFSYSPSSLRVDGYYAEMNSILGYPIHNKYYYPQSGGGGGGPPGGGGSLPPPEYKGSYDVTKGGYCFWIKPNWFPWYTGKARIFASMAKFHRYNQSASFFYAYESIFPDERGSFSPFTLFFFPAHANAAGTASSYEESYLPTNFGSQMRPASLGLAFYLNQQSGYNWELKNYPLGFPSSVDSSYYANWGSYFVTPPLNHEFHGAGENTWRFGRYFGSDWKLNWLRDHEWTHIGVTWNGITPGGTPTVDTLKIFVNGNILLGSHAWFDPGASMPHYPLWWVHPIRLAPYAAWCMNSIRLGGEYVYPMMLIDWDGGALSNLDRDRSTFPRTHTADATIDEFYFWNVFNNAATAAIDSAFEAIPYLAKRGRYYAPDDTKYWMSPQIDGFTITNYTPNGVTTSFTTGVIPALPDGMYLSHAIDLTAYRSQNQKIPPDASNITAPDGSATTVVTADEKIKARKFRLIGLSWTAYGEDYMEDMIEPDGSKRLRPIFFDYYMALIGGMSPEDYVPPSVNPEEDKNNYTNPNVGAILGNTSVYTTVDLYIVAYKDNAHRVYGPYRQESYSVLRLSHLVGNPPSENGDPIELDDPTQVRFMAKFRIGAKSLNTMMMFTPVLDDVTLYFDTGGPEFLNYGEISVVYGL